MVEELPEEPFLSEHWRTGAFGRFWSSGCRAALSKDWWEQLLQRWWTMGRRAFTSEEVQAFRGGSMRATQRVLRRARRRGQIVTPVRGFHLIVSRARHPLLCGERAIEFVERRHLEQLPIEWDHGLLGSFLMATPEVAMFDIVGYPRRCEGMKTVVGAVGDLLRVVDADHLRNVAEASPVAWSQRIGFLCDQFGRWDCANALFEYVRCHPKRNTPLALDRPVGGAPLNEVWHVYVNEAVRP